MNNPCSTCGDSWKNVVKDRESVLQRAEKLKDESKEAVAIYEDSGQNQIIGLRKAFELGLHILEIVY